MTTDTEPRVSVKVSADTSAFTAALIYFTGLLVWLERGHPRPLCIDGHEYHRRQQARRRRKR